MINDMAACPLTSSIKKNLYLLTGIMLLVHITSKIIQLNNVRCFDYNTVLCIFGHNCS